MTLALIDVAPALARLSELAYEYPLGFQRGLDRMGFRRIESYAKNDTEAFLVTNGAYAVLVFRGTEATRFHWRDLKSNLGIPVAWAGKGRAHAGYDRHLSMIRNEVTAMAERVASEMPLYVTGHSMGGALATLWAAFWYALGRGYRLKGLVTFGAPKALTRAAAGPIACDMLRVVNDYDFAPKWPPFILSHPCPAYHINSGGWPGPVSRHSPARYKKVLDGWTVSDRPTNPVT